jgi:hypothetical protein
MFVSCLQRMWAAVEQRLWTSRITFVGRYRYRYLWVVGYSFRDEHINKVITDSILNHQLDHRLNL